MPPLLDSCPGRVLLQRDPDTVKRSSTVRTGQQLADLFGNLDIYLFDQLLRGRITPEMRVVDVGCGTGRNLRYLMRAGFQVYGVDRDAGAIATVRRLASRLAPALSADQFRVESVEQMSFPNGFANVVICNAVLHFARDEQHFRAMLESAWRVLAPEGLFFARLASTVGLEDRLEHIAGRRYRQPDGDERFLVDEGWLVTLTRELGGTLADPIKTTVVQGRRAMTTWVARKRP